MSGDGTKWTASANQAIVGSQLARGTVYSYTQVQEPAAGFEAQAPFHLALVELDQGGLITAQLTDIDGEVAIGDRVELVTRKLTTDGDRGMIIYGYKFRPAMQ